MYIGDYDPPLILYIGGHGPPFIHSSASLAVIKGPIKKTLIEFIFSITRSREMFTIYF